MKLLTFGREWADRIKRVVQLVERQSFPAGSVEDSEHHQAPQVYIVKNPGEVPGRACDTDYDGVECQVYSWEPAEFESNTRSLTAVTLPSGDPFRLVVFNLGNTPIIDEYFFVKRDAFGTWIAEGTATQVLFGVTTTAIEPDGSGTVRLRNGNVETETEITAYWGHMTSGSTIASDTDVAVIWMHDTCRFELLGADCG